MAVSTLPNFFISCLFVIIELLSHVWHFCDTMDCSPRGPSVHEIFQGRILKWLAISSPRGPSWPRNQICVSCGSCTTGGYSTIEPPGKPCIRHKEGQIFVWKCSHQSWKGRDMVPARHFIYSWHQGHQSFQTGLSTLNSQLKSWGTLSLITWHTSHGW